MANNHYKHKDYTKLLEELQSKNSSDSVTSSNISEKPKEEDVCDIYTTEKSVNIDYDLTALLTGIKDLTDLIRLYDMCEEQIEYEQQITQDLLHAIEFSQDYKERYRYSTQLHYNRCRRRQYKNTCAILRPLVEFLKKEENKKVLNKLCNILGEARKAKSRVTEKTYSPRVLTEIGVISNDNKHKST